VIATSWVFTVSGLVAEAVRPSTIETVSLTL
jgi:hypothetical protein